MVSQCCSAVFILLAFTVSALATVQVYNHPPTYQPSTTFRVRAGRKRVPVLALEKYDYAHFSADAGFDVRVSMIGKVPLQKISIVASRFDYNNQPQLYKNTLKWHVNEHKYFLLKVEGLRELVVAVDPLETAAPPSQGPNIFNVASTTYKADKLGQRLTTHAFHAAISDASASQRENPIVYVPAGVYLIGNLVLPSNISLYLAPGSFLRFTGNPQDYTQDWSQDEEGRSGTNWISTAHNSTNIKIFGRGTIDGNAFAFKEGLFVPSLVVPVLTKNFVLDGPVLRESGSSAVNVVRSNAVDIRNVKVFNRLEMDTSALIVFESQNATVDNVVAISGSDTFTAEASKPPSDTGPAWPGAPQNSSDIRFQNCLAWTTHWGLKAGPDQTNITFLNSTVYDAAVGMGIHKKWGIGSVKNVTFDTVIVKALSYTASYLNGILGSWFVALVENDGSGVGPIDGVHVRNVWVLNSGGSMPLISGTAGANVTNVDFQGVRLPWMSQPASSLEELELEGMNFAYNVTVTVVDTQKNNNGSAPLETPEDIQPEDVRPEDVQPEDIQTELELA